VLVLSAWCLGILNSHRRFFLSYAAPVLWNGAIIAALLGFGGRADSERLAEYVAWGATIGCLLQFGAQLPSALRLLGRFRPAPRLADPTCGACSPASARSWSGAAWLQISAYVDTAYASLVSARALAALSYAQAIYLLPVSLFGMAVSAAELPEMSREGALGGDRAESLRGRVAQASARIAFFVIPSVVALALLGDVMGRALLQTGRFDGAESRYAGYLLMGSAVGLLAATLGPPLLLGLLRARRHAHAALVRDRAGGARRGAGVGSPPPVCRTCSARRATWGAAGITAAAASPRGSSSCSAARAPASHRRRARDGAAGRLWLAALLAAAAALGLKWWLSVSMGVDPAGRARVAGEWLPAPRPAPDSRRRRDPRRVRRVYLSACAALGVPQVRRCCAGSRRASDG